MTRYCDGTDPNLIMHVDSAGQRIDKLGDVQAVVDAFLALPSDARRRARAAISQIDDGTDAVGTKPCDCGRAFDDARRSTVWPHEEI